MIKKVIRLLFLRLGYDIKPIKDKNGDKKLVLNYDDYHKLKINYAAYDKLKIHFGCGPRILKGWINIDLSYEPFHKYMQYYTNKYYPEEIRGDRSDFYAIDITKTALPLPDSSVDVIFHEDFLEHLSQRDQIVFLAETLRVLKPGGVHRVNTPNLLSSMQDRSNFERGYSGVYIDEWNKHNHLNVLTPSMLREIALMVGYSNICFNGRDQSISKEIPLEYRPDPHDRLESGNIFADLIK